MSDKTTKPSVDLSLPADQFMAAIATLPKDERDRLEALWAERQVMMMLLEKR